MKSIKQLGAVALSITVILVYHNVDAGYCIVPDDPLLCAHRAGGWLPGRTSVFCDFGGIRVEFYNGVYLDPCDIYTPRVRYDGDDGANHDKPGDLQTSTIHIYSVSNCVQSVEEATTYWYGCTGWVPADSDCHSPY